MSPDTDMVAAAPSVQISYTPQSTDLLWLRIELVKLDIFGTMHGTIAGGVAQRSELIQSTYLLTQSTSAAV